MSDKAHESRKVRKARAKLKKQMKKEQEAATPEALKGMGDKIRSWITRHSPERESLKEKAFQLFDENQHSVDTTSNYVQGLQKGLKKTLKEGISSSLKGRVTVKKQ